MNLLGFFLLGSALAASSPIVFKKSQQAELIGLVIESF